MPCLLHSYNILLNEARFFIHRYGYRVDIVRIAGHQHPILPTEPQILIDIINRRLERGHIILVLTLLKHRLLIKILTLTGPMLLPTPIREYLIRFGVIRLIRSLQINL